MKDVDQNDRKIWSNVQCNGESETITTVEVLLRVSVITPITDIASLLNTFLCECVLGTNFVSSLCEYLLCIQHSTENCAKYCHECSLRSSIRTSIQSPCIA